jgi:two-component system, LytTR family, sensor kinase
VYIQSAFTLFSYHPPLLPVIPDTIDCMERNSQKISQIAFAYLWSILIWMGLASLAAGEDTIRISERGFHTSYWTALLVNGVWALSAALLTPPTFAIVHRYPITKPVRFGRVAGYVLGGALYAVACACLRWILLPPWNSPAQHFEHRSLHGLVASFSIFAELIWDYIIIVAAAHAYEYFKRARDQELERAELQQALATSELQALKSQLHPHFLFNTLQGISALIDTDKARAKTMVVKISSLLRTALQYGSSDLITFDEELKFVENYLDLEKMRLEERLELRWAIAPETRQLLVPQLIMQPLVENAILHGIACCRGGGWIEIVSWRAEDALEIRIRNSVGGRQREGMGLGLQNTRARLKHLYADEADIFFDLGTNGVATASVRVPAISAPKQAPKGVSLSPASQGER